MRGLPPKLLASPLARGGLVDAEDHAQESELLGRDWLDGQLELAANEFGEGAHCVTLVGDGMGHRAWLGSFQSQPEEPGGIEAMHGRPALVTVADIARDSGSTGRPDE